MYDDLSDCELVLAILLSWMREEKKAEILKLLEIEEKEEECRN